MYTAWSFKCQGAREKRNQVGKRRECLWSWSYQAPRQLGPTWGLSWLWMKRGPADETSTQCAIFFFTKCYYQFLVFNMGIILVFDTLCLPLLSETYPKTPILFASGNKVSNKCFWGWVLLRPALFSWRSTRNDSLFCFWNGVQIATR